MINKNLKFHLSDLERILPIFCFRKKATLGNIYNYKEMKKYIINQIDIKNIIKKLNELEKIKYIILDNDQLNILENLDNPPSYYIHFLKNKDSIWNRNREIDEESDVYIEKWYKLLKSKIMNATATDLEKNIFRLYEFIYDIK